MPINLVKTVLTIRFDSATKPWLEMRDILRVASGDQMQEIQAAPLILDRANQKKRIIIQVRAIQHEDELHGSIDEANKEAINVMSSINNASAFPKVTSMRYATVFIEPFSIPFHELVAFLKERFLRPTRIGNASSDIALIFDQREEGVRKQIHIGPMDQAQLQSDVLRWPGKSLPPVCVFLGLTYESNEATSFSQPVLESFLQKATTWQTTEARTLVSELKEVST